MSRLYALVSFAGLVAAVVVGNVTAIVALAVVFAFCAVVSASHS